MCTCTRTHARVCTHMHVWHHREFPGIPPVGGGHLHEIIMFTTHACACVHAHACACMWGAFPNHPPPPSTHPPPPPRAAGSPKHQNSISLELIKIIQFCLKIFLPLKHSLTHIDYSWSPPDTPPPTCPTPQSRGKPNRKNYNNSWMNWDNSILFEDLGTPEPSCTHID